MGVYARRVLLLAPLVGVIVASLFVLPLGRLAIEAGGWAEINTAAASGLGQFVYHCEGTQVRRVGRLWIGRDDRAEALLFSDFETLDSADLTPVRLDGSLSSLWALQSDAGKAEITGRLAGLGTLLGTSLKAVLGSDAWTKDYRPRFRQIMSQAGSTALDDSAVGAVMPGALGVLGEQFEVDDTGQDFASEYMRIFAGYAAKEIFELAKQLALAIFKQNLKPEDLERLESPFVLTFKDPEIQASLKRRLRRFTETEEAMDLAGAFAFAYVSALYREQNEHGTLSSLGLELFSDPRFEAELAGAEVEAMSALRDIARKLLTVDDGEALHPLAALMIRRLIWDQPGDIVLLVSAKEDCALDIERTGRPIELKLEAS